MNGLSCGVESMTKKTKIQTYKLYTCNGQFVRDRHKSIAALDWLQALWVDYPTSDKSLSTKLRPCNTFIVSVLLYGCETWTLLQSDERRIEAFHMS